MNNFEVKLNDLLVNTFNSILKYEETSLRAISETPVTIGEVHMIERIARRKGGSSVSEIAEDMDIALPTATVAVKKLERKGFVTRTPNSEDGRRSIITLTPLGERIEHAHSIFHRRMVRNISRSFNESEQEVLIEAISKLNDFFIKQTEE